MEGVEGWGEGGVEEVGCEQDCSAFSHTGLDQEKFCSVRVESDPRILIVLLTPLDLIVLAVTAT